MADAQAGRGRRAVWRTDLGSPVLGEFRTTSKEHTASCTSDHHHYQQQPPATTAIPAHTSLSLFSLVIPLPPNLFPSSLPSPPIPPQFKPPYLPLLSFFNLWVTGLAVPFLVRRSISVGAPCLVRPTWFPPSKKSTPPSRDLPSPVGPAPPTPLGCSHLELALFSPTTLIFALGGHFQWTITWRSIRRGRPNLTTSPRPPTRGPYPPSMDGSKA